MHMRILLGFLLCYVPTAYATTLHISPSDSVSLALTQLHPGDTLLLHGGVYTQSISWQHAPLPKGTSWRAPVTIAGAPGETVILRGVLDIGTPSHKDPLFLIFRDFTIDAQGIGGNNGTYIGASYVRLQNLDIKNYPANGVQVAGNHNEFLNLQVHNSTRQRYHGFYIWGANNLLDGVEVFNNSGYGIQVYKADGNNVDHNIIRNSRVHDNGHSTNNGGIIISHGDGNQVYNNVVYHNTSNANGIDIAYQATNTFVDHNTVVNNGNHGIAIDATTKGTRLTNNILYGNNTSDITIAEIQEVIQRANSTSDPHFVSDTNFHLQAGSPALTASTTGSQIGAYGGGSGAIPTPGEDPIIPTEAVPQPLTPYQLRLIIIR